MAPQEDSAILVRNRLPVLDIFRGIAVIAWSSIAIIGSAISEFLTNPKISHSSGKATLMASGIIFRLDSKNIVIKI